MICQRKKQGLFSKNFYEFNVSLPTVAHISDLIFTQKN